MSTVPSGAALDAGLSVGVRPRRAAPDLPVVLPRPAGRRPVALHRSDNPAERSELRRRGTTVIEEKVFAKIAGQAASEVAASRGRTGGVLGIGSEADTGARPKVDVELSADSVDLDLAVGIAYPGSIRTAAQQVRDRVTSTVHELTGVPVHRVDIDVTFLTPNGATSNGPTSNGADGQGRPTVQPEVRRQHRKQVLR